MTTQGPIAGVGDQVPPQEPGRVEALLRRSPFWFEVAHGVTSGTTTAYVVAWVGSTIILAGRGGPGDDLQWSDALAWSLVFLLLGVQIVALATLVHAAADYPSDPTRRRYAVFAAGVYSWLNCWTFGGLVPARHIDVTASFLVITLVLGVASGVSVALAKPPPPGRQPDWTQTTWRVAHLAIGIAVALMSTVLIGLALGGVFQRAT